MRLAVFDIEKILGVGAILALSDKQDASVLFHDGEPGRAVWHFFHPDKIAALQFGKNRMERDFRQWLRLDLTRREDAHETNCKDEKPSAHGVKVKETREQFNRQNTPV